VSFGNSITDNDPIYKLKELGHNSTVKMLPRYRIAAPDEYLAVTGMGIKNSMFSSF